MLIKFFPRGTGKGSGPVEYIIRKDDPITKQPRTPAPEILRGDPEITSDLIDSLDFQQKYTSGVISFAPSDAPTPEQQEALMNSFEKHAFAGLEPDQYDILWVRHTHTNNGRVELHFVTPKVELTTGKSLNIAPPGWQKYFDPMRDYWNYSLGWARPNDPERARVYSPGKTALIEAMNQRANLKPEKDNRQLVTDVLVQQIEEGNITNRSDIINFLKKAGLEIPRAGKNYITVLDRETGERFRLKGGIYEETWRPQSTLTASDRKESKRDFTVERIEAQRAREQLEQCYKRRWSYNQKHYQSRELEDSKELQPDRRDAQSKNTYSYPSHRPILDNSGIDSIEPLGGLYRRELGMDGTRIQPHPEALGDTGKIEQRDRNLEAHQGQPTPKDLGSRVDEDRQRKVYSTTPQHEEQSQLDLFGSTLHQARGLANERDGADIEYHFEGIGSTVQAGYGEARRSEQTTDAASDQLRESSKQLEAANRQLNQCLHQSNQNLGRGRLRKERQLKEELERFKTDINLVEYALAQGYEYDRSRSTRSSAVLEHGNGDKVVVTTDRDGHGIYFSVRNNRDNGTIIDFVQNRQPYNLGFVRKELRPWLEGHSTYRAETIPKPQAIAVDRQEILERLSRMKVATSHPYLEDRGISKRTLSSDRFAETVYINDLGNAIFPHHDRDGVTGFEGRNYDFKGFSSGGNKSIWRSNLYTSDRRLVVVESPIDALSYHQLYQEPDTRYIATGGSVGERQLEFIKSVFERAASRGMEIEIATDKDSAGEKLYEQLLERVPNDAKVSRVTPNKHKDWNELLQAKLEQQKQQEQQKQRDRGLSL